MDQVDGFDQVDLPGVGAEVLLDCVLIARGDKCTMPDTCVLYCLPIEPI